MIKNHPIYSEMTVEDYGCTNLSFAPEYVSGNLNDCLADVDIAIASMTSSSLEVLFSGTPLIIMVPRGQFGFTSLPEKVRNQMCSIVYDAVELSNAIDQIMDYGDFDNSTLEDLLVPKTRENVMCLFI